MTATSVLGNSCGDIRLVAGSSNVKSECFWSEQVVYERYEKSVAFYGDFYLRISKHSVTISWSSLTISLGGDHCNWREWVLWLTSLLLAVKSYLWLTQSATSRADVLLLCLDIRAAWEAAVLLPLAHKFFFPSGLLHCPSFSHSHFLVPSVKWHHFCKSSWANIFWRVLNMDVCFADCFSAVPGTKWW